MSQVKVKSAFVLPAELQTGVGLGELDNLGGDRG